MAEFEHREFYEPCNDGGDVCLKSLIGYSIDNQVYFDPMFDDLNMCLVYKRQAVYGGVNFGMPNFDDGRTPSDADIIAYMNLNFPIPETIYFSSTHPTPGYSQAGKREILSWSMSNGYTVPNNCTYITSSIEDHGAAGWYIESTSIGIWYWYTDLADPLVCPPNSHYDNGTCIPDEGWEWDEGCGCFVPINPGIPNGPSLSPPELIPPITPGGNDCPDCYTYDDVSGMCIYTGGEGCDPVEPPCVETAGCDATPITGVCEGRDECI